MKIMTSIDFMGLFVWEMQELWTNQFLLIRFDIGLHYFALLYCNGTYEKNPLAKKHIRVFGEVACA